MYGRWRKLSCCHGKVSNIAVWQHEFQCMVDGENFHVAMVKLAAWQYGSMNFNIIAGEIFHVAGSRDW